MFQCSTDLFNSHVWTARIHANKIPKIEILFQSRLQCSTHKHFYHNKECTIYTYTHTHIWPLFPPSFCCHPTWRHLCTLSSTERVYLLLSIAVFPYFFLQRSPCTYEKCSHGQIVLFLFSQVCTCILIIWYWIKSKVCEYV